MLRFGIALFLVLLWLGSAAAPGTAFPSPPVIGNACGWRLIPAPSTTNDGNELLGVWATSSTDAWAVGYHSDNFSGDSWPLTEHFNGTAWSIVSSPQPEFSSVSSVREISPTDVWAVGTAQNQSTFANQTLTMHWNGSSWTIIPSPNAGTVDDELHGLAYSNSNDVWAFGYSFDTVSGHYLTLTEHWNGASWSIVPSVSVTGANNFLIAGGAVNPLNVWTVGYAQGNGSPGALAEVWNGSVWTGVPTPNIGYSIFRAFTPIGRRDSWAIGDTSNGTNLEPLAERWNGSTFSVASTPTVSGRNVDIWGAAAVNANDVWAVGNVESPDRTFTMNWNGASWSIVASPNRGTRSNVLDAAVTIPGTTNVWAVGKFFRTSLQSHVLVMKFHC